MPLNIARFVPGPPGSWLMATLFAIASGAAYADDRPAEIRDYRPVFAECRGTDGAIRLAIRRMKVDGTGMMLTVDSLTLTTRLELEQDWSCAETDDDRQKNTRYVRAIRSAAAPHDGGPAPATDVIVNGGVVRGATTGSFITGDLCPSRRPLDRAFLESLEGTQSPLPLALSISSLWLIRHKADFEWLRDRERAGAITITWVDHSYHHPYVPGRRLDDNFLLTAGVDIRAEILDAERLLIASGETPSVFFRFPGLVSNPALMRAVADYHLIALGADAWLARSPSARPGAIILVHPNGNEPAGLAIFSALLAAGKLPHPFRPIEDAP
jgi:hypothetical protein